MFWLILALVAAALLGALVLLARLAFASRQECLRFRDLPERTGERVLYVSDPYSGSRLNPSVETFIRRPVTGETYHTDDRGARVPAPGRKAGPRRFVFIGCSWVLGTGHEWETSFVGQLQKRHGLDLANLGVGSFSLLQAIRHLEKNAPYYRPRVVVLGYGHWLVNRCFKTNAFGREMGQRPVIHERGDGLVIQEVLYNPGTALLQAHHDAMGVLSGEEEFSFRHLTAYAKAAFVRWLVRTRRSLTKRLTGRRLKDVDSSRHNDRALRDKVLTMLFGELEALAERHDFMVLWYHLFEFKFADEQYQGRYLPIIEGDGRTIARLAGKSRRIVYQEFGPEKQRYDEYMAAHGMDPGAYSQPFSFPDDPHPDIVACSFIADSMVEALDRHGLHKAGS